MARVITPTVKVVEKDIPYARLTDASTDEVLTMVLGREYDEEEDDISIGFKPGDLTIGRMSVLLDESEFDVIPPFHSDIQLDEEQESPDLRIARGDAVEDVQISGPPPVFSPLAEAHFPVFLQALRHFQSTEPRGRVVRIDTPATYETFIGVRAADEIERRLDAIEAAMRAHDEDPFAHRAAFKHHEDEEHGGTDIIGAVETVSKLGQAKTADEATDALPSVPVDVPAYAEDKVKCWRDGPDVVVSLRFGTVEGEPRYATMIARPRADADSVARAALDAGVEPVTVLGVLPELAASACGKRLVRDVAGAALQAHDRLDVCVMGAEPLLLANRGAAGTAPLAALMYLQQQSDAGDAQASQEMEKIRLAADTPTGRKVAGPLLEEASRRLAMARSHR